MISFACLADSSTNFSSFSLGVGIDGGASGCDLKVEAEWLQCKGCKAKLTVCNTCLHLLLEMQEQVEQWSFTTSFQVLVSVFKA